MAANGSIERNDRLRTSGVSFKNKVASDDVASQGEPAPGVQLPIWSSGKAKSSSINRGGSLDRTNVDTGAGGGIDDVDGNYHIQRLTSRVASQFSIRAAISGNVNFSWHQVSVELPPNPKKNLPGKTIIDGINGQVKSGSLLAVMGASGAGKTTFLNLLTDRTASALHVSAVLAINNHAVSSGDIRKISSYVQQQDLFFGTLTVIEHLTIQALLRMNKALTTEERLARVHEVLDELGLTKVTNSLIGSTAGGMRGISGGEQKRLAFATEVLTDPPLMFADEPTSGLDSFASQSVVQHLKKMAEAGRTIMCTIHQPPSEVFDNFDQLLLLAEGRTAYLGPRADAVEHFSRLGYDCPVGYNPADFYIYTLAVKPNEKEASKAQIKAITDAYVQHEVEQGIPDRPLPEKSDSVTKAVQDLGHQHGESLFTQFRVVAWRTFLLTIRNPLIIQVNIMTTLLTSLIIGLVFLRTGFEGDIPDRVQGIAGSMFFVIALAAFNGVTTIVQVVPAERPAFLRDYENNMYFAPVYFLCRYVSTIPITLFLQLLSTAMMYFMIGFDSSADRFFIFYVVVVMVVFVSESIGYIIAAASGDNTSVAFALAPIATVPLMLFAGLLLNLDSTPPYFLWLEKISHMRWAFEAGMINEFRNDTLDVNCTVPPCFINGEVVLDSYSLDNSLDTIGGNIGILAGLMVGYRAVALITTMIILRVGVKR